MFFFKHAVGLWYGGMDAGAIPVGMQVKEGKNAKLPLVAKLSFITCEMKKN